jgi:hypothetical protein
MEFTDKIMEEILETPTEQVTIPLWNWKTVLTTLVLFFLGIALLMILQALLLTDVFGKALIDINLDQEMTSRVILLTLLGLTATGIGSIWLSVIVIGKRSWRQLGFKPLTKNWLRISIGLALVLVFVRVVIGTVLAVRYPSLAEGMEDLLFTPGTDLLTNLGLLLLIALVIPIWEELFFRGFLYKWFRNRLGMWAAIGLSALVFGIFHLIPLQMFLAGIMGIALAWIYERSNTLWAPILMHMINNLIVGLFSIWLLMIENGLS